MCKQNCQQFRYWKRRLLIYYGSLPNTYYIITNQLLWSKLVLTHSSLKRFTMLSNASLVWTGCWSSLLSNFFHDSMVSNKHNDIFYVLFILPKSQESWWLYQRCLPNRGNCQQSCLRFYFLTCLVACLPGSKQQICHPFCRPVSQRSHHRVEHSDRCSSFY